MSRDLLCIEAQPEEQRMDTVVSTGNLQARAAAAVHAWPLARGHVRVVLVEADAWRPHQREAESLMDDAERGRVSRRRLARDRDDLALCYGLHRALLAAWLDCAPRAVPLYRDERGCPRLEGGELATSLSHAEGAFAFAFARAADGPVGVDIEPAQRAALMDEVAQALCHPAERERYGRLRGPAASIALLRLWVRKEAVLKALGTGMEVPMESFRIPDSAVVHLPALQAQPLRTVLVDAGALQYECAVACPDGRSVTASWLRP
ncbi:MAG TPA: 4'-phosphopantetheinyl transferase superfamily protein [Lysobacter sp.]